MANKLVYIYNKLVHIGLDNSTFWVIAAVLQLVSNHLLVQKEMESATTTGIAAAVFWILATLRLTQQTSGITVQTFDAFKESVKSSNKVVPICLLLGSILFLVSYLIKPNTEDIDKMVKDLKMIWGIAMAGGFFYVVAAGTTFKDTFWDKVVPRLVPAGAACFVLGALLTMVSMLMNITNNSQSGLAYASALFLVLGALCWKINNIKTPPAPAAEPSSSSSSRSNVEQRLLDGMRRRR
ncbi:MAG: hypothetical protein CBC65_001050 [Rhodothermaceae bacterium TMED105]|nr:MAG: hypothetical protein CBC65_001050 [Rhodothermaceae bacterium TMED105]|tara:strand:- start:44 stop:757 length:714 start_codon:yes stop_codon:yes gene_type:complete